MSSRDHSLVLSTPHSRSSHAAPRRHAIGSGLAASLLAVLVALPGCSPDKGETDGETAGTTGTTGTAGTTGTTSMTGTTDDSTTTGDGPTTGSETTSGNHATPGTTGPDESTGDPVTPDAEVAALCQDHLAGMVSAQGTLCACLVEAGDYPDMATCLASEGTFNQEQIDCRCGVYAVFPESRPGLECAIAAAGTFTACVEQLVCSDPAFIECFDSFFAALFNECEQPSPALDTALYDACESGEGTFLCGSGEQILSRGVCDGRADCDDGSDEADCR